MNKLFLGENLNILKNIPTNSIDLVATDPPFNSGKDWGEFNDKWEGGLNGYLEFMEVRIVEIHRVLKDTGSFYLHCDQNASHYLKILSDQIFGITNFVNDITWDTASINVAGYKSKANKWIYAKGNILYYRMDSTDYTFHKQYIQRNNDFIEKHYRNSDSNGVFRITRRGNKVYLKDDKGDPVTDVWKDILSFNYVCAAKESVGYPTQKPVALYKRIIKASSNEGDIILDPFCGSGTTLDAAQSLKRQWIGIDNQKQAIETIIERMKNKHNLLIECE